MAKGEKIVPRTRESRWPMGAPSGRLRARRRRPSTDTAFSLFTPDCRGRRHGARRAQLGRLPALSPGRDGWRDRRRFLAPLPCERRLDVEGQAK